jgi:hypothetical protein
MDICIELAVGGNSSVNSQHTIVMRVVVITDYAVVFGDASLTQRNHLGGIVQLAYALHFGIVTSRRPVALIGPFNNRFADLLALLRDFVWFQVGKGADDVAEQDEAGKTEYSEAALLKDRLGMASYPGIKTRRSERKCGVYIGNALSNRVIGLRIGLSSAFPLSNHG